MPERRDIQEALREAVERTVQATVETRDRAQGAAGGVAEAVDDLVKGAERSISRSRRSVSAVVGDRLPATQEDVRTVRAELHEIAVRLDAIEQRLGDTPKA